MSTSELSIGRERVNLFGLDDNLIVDRIASDLIVEDGNSYYVIETFIRSLIIGDGQPVSNKVDAGAVAAMFRDLCPCGGRTCLYHGLAGYTAGVCQVCGEHWDATNQADHEKQLQDYAARNAA
jgi:hypothetical protein